MVAVPVVASDGIDFSIAPQRADRALIEFARQASLTVLIPTEPISQITAHAVRGHYRVEEALAILLRGTGLQAELTAAGSITVKTVRNEGDSAMPSIKKRSWLSAFVASILGSFTIHLSARAAEATAGADTTADTTAGSRNLEEVTVTARRREENVQKVPIAVTVLSQQALTQNNVGTLNQLQYLVPSLTVIPNGYSETVAINIRGQGAAYGGGQPGVIMYLNDVPIPSVATGSWGGPGLFFDLQNAQVLKGPQGTLFGRNSVGGNVVLESARPTNNFDAYLQAAYGNYKDHEFTGALNVPLISDVLLMRVAFETQMRDGFSHVAASPGRPNGFDGDDRNTHAIRATLTFRPVDWLQNDTIGGYADYHQAGSPARVVPSTTANAASATYPNFESYVAEQQALGPRFYIPIGNDDISEGSLVSLSNITRVTFNDQLTFRNIVGYESVTQRLQIDQDGTPLPAFDYPVPPPPTTGAPIFAARGQFTEEAQLLGKAFDGRLDWIAGGFFLDDPGTKGPPVNGHSSLVALGSHIPQSVLQNGEWSRALFSQATFSLMPRVKITGGARYTWDSVRLRTLGNLPTSICSGPMQVDCDADTGTVNRASSHAITWTTGIDYQVQPDTLLYLAAHRGYRGGGFNEPNEGFSPPPYGPEFVTDGELGIKSDWKLGGVAIRTNADVWYETYTEIQLTANIPEPVTPLDPAGYIAYTINAGTGKLYGAELETQALLSDDFKVGVSFDYTKRNYMSFNPFVPQATVADIRASETLGTPLVKYGINASYRLPMRKDVGEVSISGVWNWQDKSGDISVPRGYGLIPSFGLLNLAADWKGVFGSDFDISLFASNVLDKVYISDAVPFWQPGFWGGSIYFGEPRMYGIRLQYHLDATKLGK